MPHGEAVVSNSSGQWLLFTELLIQLPFCTPVIVAVIHFVTHIKAKLSRSLDIITRNRWNSVA